MWRFLKNLFSGNRQYGIEPQMTLPGNYTTSGLNEIPVEHRGHVLITRRTENPSDDMPGFRELYCCTTCRDYFWLAWQPKSGQPMSGCQVVLQNMLPGTNTDLDSFSIFCPKCAGGYAQYGLVLWPGSLKRKWC